MKSRIVALAVVLVALLAVVSSRPALSAPSPQLSSALSTLRGLTESQFEKVVYWSRNGTPRPFMQSTPVERAELQILNLPQAGRNATLSWLQGYGRDALYERGATDSDIGSRRPAVMNPGAATPTPNPYRALTFATNSLGGHNGHIQILGGFAGVRRDGTAAVACLSFKNISQRTAVEVVFDFGLLGPAGGQLGELRLVRSGQFSPGIDINGWPDLGSWQSGIGHRGYGDNCEYVTQGVASTPLLRAQTVTVQVVRVRYDDGTVWPRNR